MGVVRIGILDKVVYIWSDKILGKFFVFFYFYSFIGIFVIDFFWILQVVCSIDDVFVVDMNGYVKIVLDVVKFLAYIGIGMLFLIVVFCYFGVLLSYGVGNFFGIIVFGMVDLYWYL